MMTPVWSLAEEHKFGRIFFYHLSPFLSTPKNINSDEFFCAFGSSFIILDTRFHLFMVQPVSPILILIGLGFRIFSPNRSSSAQPVILVLSTFVPMHHASSFFLPFLLPSRLVASTFRPRQYHSSFLALLGVRCIQCSRWV